MGNRLSKIATRTGDNGTTGLGDGSRTGKDSLRVHSMGDVDELNSHIGLLLCEELPPALREELVSIQHDLTIVTRNVKDFAGLGVTVFNPWYAV